MFYFSRLCFVNLREAKDMKALAAAYRVSFIINDNVELSQAVQGGCTVMMFGSIMYEGIKMLEECEFDDRTRTMIIVSLPFVSAWD